MQMQKPSLYAQYILERQGRSIIEDDNGFATYEINGEDCYIADIFVIKEKRRSRIAWDFADKVVAIAKDKGCKNLFGTVDPKAFGAEQSAQGLIAYGFKFKEYKDNLVWFFKEI